MHIFFFLKDQLENTLMDVKQKIKERNKNIIDMKESVKLSKVSLEITLNYIYIYL